MPENLTDKRVFTKALITLSMGLRSIERIGELRQTHGHNETFGEAKRG